jgi:kynurenine 3-monooxygenase
MKGRIAIVGAGLVGSLLSIYLSRRGYSVTLFERRGDMRVGSAAAGRSINLALSSRGIRALDDVGLAAAIKKVAIPMHGRTMHDPAGKITFLAYGKQGQFINSISRSGLNVTLMNEAEREGVKIRFDCRLLNLDLEATRLTIQHEGHTEDVSFDYCVGADGAFSAVRGVLQTTDRFNYAQEYIEHGYKELTIPPGPNGSFQLEKNALHIWPRESYMLIALPNPDGSFTCTLFFPWEGPLSFQSLQDQQTIIDFFNRNFPDAAVLIPNLLEAFSQNPTSSLVTIKCFPWVRNKTLLIGDAAHALVPFYGQGMNAGFEDCRIFNELLDDFDDDWSKALPKFQGLRKADSDAIAQLALDNFVEMRDLVADAEFLLRKKIESRLNELFPDQWIPLYSMVTFRDDIRYSDALQTGRRQKVIMDQVMQAPNIANTWQQLDFQKIVDQLKPLQ